MGERVCTSESPEQDILLWHMGSTQMLDCHCWWLRLLFSATFKHICWDQHTCIGFSESIALHGHWRFPRWSHKDKKKKKKEGPRKLRDQALVECTTAGADNLSSPEDFKGAKPQWDSAPSSLLPRLEKEGSGLDHLAEWNEQKWEGNVFLIVLLTLMCFPVTWEQISNYSKSDIPKNAPLELTWMLFWLYLSPHVFLSSLVWVQK